MSFYNAWQRSSAIIFLPYTLTVTAEDIAHNIGSQEVTIEVLP